MLLGWLPSSPKQVKMTYAEAVALARKLKDLGPAILGVELFGSVASKGRGRDADFAILVGQDLARRWWQEERERIRVRWPDALYGQRWIVKKFLPFAYAATVRGRRRRRLEASADMLGIELGKISDENRELPDFEMFLAPVGWRDGKELNMEVMRGITDLVDHRNTLGMLKRIATGAVRVA